MKELFGDVKFTVGVLEGEIELVGEPQCRVALGLVVARAAERPTVAVDIYGHVLAQLLDVFIATISGDAVRHKPCD